MRSWKLELDQTMPVTELERVFRCSGAAIWPFFLKNGQVAFENGLKFAAELMEDLMKKHPDYSMTGIASQVRSAVWNVFCDLIGSPEKLPVSIEGLEQEISDVVCGYHFKLQTRIASRLAWLWGVYLFVHVLSETWWPLGKMNGSSEGQFFRIYKAVALGE